jgi:dihydropteroate synthase
VSIPDRAFVVGILNVTPDSFSDGGRFAGTDDAVAAALAMVDAGALWIDVGGESTRPGALAVSEAEERARVIPVIEALAARLREGGASSRARTRISVDTYKAGTARAALAAGATIVNDVSGGSLDPDILNVAARAGAAIVVGHMRGNPATMMQHALFADVVSEVTTGLSARIDSARAAGCREIWADPGIGFGKHTEDNLRLLAQLPALCRRLEVPVMVGVSRKRFVGDLVHKPVAERTFGTAGAVAASVLGGAAAVRVHDVPAMCDVVRVADAIRAAARAHA